MTWEQLTLRLAVAALAGMAIGIEREWREKAAGFRTLTLVSAGSAVFMLVALATAPSEAVRMMAGITAGVGFLGAGAVLRDRGRVFGLTTAAAVWMSSAVGVAAALGLYSLTAAGVALTIIVLFVLSLIPYEHVQTETRTYSLTWPGTTPYHTLTSCEEFEARGATAHFSAISDADDHYVVLWTVDGPRPVHEALAEDLAGRSDIETFAIRSS